MGAAEAGKWGVTGTRAEAAASMKQQSNAAAAACRAIVSAQAAWASVQPQHRAPPPLRMLRARGRRPRSMATPAK